MNILTDKFEKSQAAYDDAKKRYKAICEIAEKAKVEVLRVRAELDDIGTARPQPNEPQFPELPEIPYVPRQPASGGLDARGKKKKNLPSNNLKDLMQTVEDGHMDGKENWDFGDFWPSKGQSDKLEKEEFCKEYCSRCRAKCRVGSTSRSHGAISRFTGYMGGRRKETQIGTCEGEKREP